MYVNNSTAYAKVANALVSYMETGIQSMSDDYLAHRGNFDSNTQALFWGITQTNVCTYLAAIQAAGADFMFLPKATCNTMNKGWGREGLYTFVMYGMRQAEENTASFITNGSSVGCEPNTGSFLDYYYQSAYVVKPATEYMITLLQDKTESWYSSWKTWRIWVSALLLAYLVLLVVGMVAWVLRLSGKYRHYSTFYTVLPKRIRDKSEPLAEHVRELVRAADS